MKTIIYMNGKDITINIQKVIETNPNGTKYVAVNATSPTYPLVTGFDYINETLSPERDIEAHNMIGNAIENFKEDMKRSVIYYSKEVTKMHELLNSTRLKGGFL